MRQAKWLSLLGLIAILLVVGGTLVGGFAGAQTASAQAPLVFSGTKTCVQPITGGGANNSGVPLVTDCTVTLTVPLAGVGTVVPGASTVGLQDILLDPHACFVPGFAVPPPSGTNTPSTPSVSPCSSGTTSVATAASVPIPTAAPVADQIACPAPGISAALGTGATATTLTVTCSLPPIVIIGPTNLCEEIDLTIAGLTVGTNVTTVTGKAQVCPLNPPLPPGPATNPLTGVTVTKTCTPSFAGATAGATKVTDCTLVFVTGTGAQFNNGTTLEFDTITGGNAVFSTALTGQPPVTTNGCENGVGGGGILSNSNQTYTCVVGPIIVSGSTTLCETVQILDPLGNSSAKLNVCPTGTTPTPTSGLNFTVVKNCTAFVPPTITAGGTSVTDCTLVFTSAAGTAFPPDVYVADDTITSAGASFSSTTAALNGIELVGTASGGFCQSGVSTGTVSGFTLTCALPPIVVTTLPNQICETVELGSATLGFSSKVNVCGFAAPTPTPTPVVSALQPTDENKTCTNTASNALLNQTLGGTSQSLGVSGPGKTFTLPLFSGASTCAIQLYRGGTACNTTTNTCADGNVQVTLSTGGGAAISCAASGLPAGQVLPTVSGGGGACQQQVQNTQINVPCGVTAGTADASTKVSNTCTGVLFDIQSLLGACVNSPTSGFCSGFNGSNFAGTTATVTVIFFSTPANGGSVGGIQLGTNTFTFSAPAIGLLLVSASPQLIPSNGTVASVVTATFACGTGASSINGFPLSNTGVAVPATFTTGSTTIVNQPIIGTGQNAVCGAGLAGTFSFTSPGPVLFDNGRSSETVNCGVGGNVSPFGVGAAPFGTPFGFAGNGINSTYPLVFTCTGAAVLAIGAGVAGDAPINVVYQGPLGLSAVGSTLITVSPSGIPRIAVSCNPSTIAAGSTGSICTATVTDINGTPLSGMTGATVTWTTSDPSNASILPCLVNVPGNLNITTYPNIAPQISPSTPCQVPTGQIPGQNTTFLNGQAAALLVASPTAHPETVTVTAALGVLIPPSFSCLVSPYLPQGYGTITTPFTAPSSVGLPGTTGCGFGNPVGFTGLSTALSPTTNGLGIGGVILPNTTSASTTVNIGGPAGILIAGATPTQPYALLRGCNQVIATTVPGTPIANIAALVSPASAVVSIWRFSNNTKQFQAGFFSDPNAPTDFNITGGVNAAPSNTTTGTQAGPGTAGNQVTETYFICVNQASTIVSG